jgi:SPP1 gp7 family putative phage head morphogenesis protein
MTQAEYWRKRFEQLEQARAASAETLNATLEREFRAAQKTIDGEIARWYQRFATNNGITLAEARQWLTGKDLAEFRWDVNEYIKYAKENIISKAWTTQLENASARIHISRLEALNTVIEAEIQALYGKVNPQVESLMERTLDTSYLHTAFEFQKGVGIAWSFVGLPKKQITDILSKPWQSDGRTFSKRIWNQQAKLTSELQTALTQNLILGKPERELAKTISEKFGTSKYNAQRVVRTESSYFAAQGRLALYKALGIEKYKVLATLDLKTSEICAEMDGKVFKVSEFESGVTANPFHPNCRTTTTPYLDDDDKITGKRIARSADGKTYYVDRHTTYKEWKKAFVDGGSKKDFQPLKVD